MRLSLSKSVQNHRDLQSTRYPRHSPYFNSQQFPKMSKRLARGVIFDMDGTLTKPVIDFQEMRRRANILVGDILEVMDTLPKAERDRVAAAIEEVENEALPKMAINDGVLELCKVLDKAQVPRALLTRNTANAIAHFHDNHFSLPPFRPALARDFRPFKPSPAAILHICRDWGFRPWETVMIGDSLKDDVVAGNRAGTSTILLEPESIEDHTAQGEQKPTFVARNMQEVVHILQTEFVLGNGAADEAAQSDATAR